MCGSSIFRLWLWAPKIVWTRAPNYRNLGLGCYTEFDVALRIVHNIEILHEYYTHTYTVASDRNATRKIDLTHLHNTGMYLFAVRHNNVPRAGVGKSISGRGSHVMYTSSPTVSMQPARIIYTWKTSRKGLNDAYGIMTIIIIIIAAA
jgi:hypothetical protein